MKDRVARYHNIFGPEGTWDGGKEKAPAAICRKVAKANRAARSRSGATASRPARSSTSTNASRAPCACCARRLRGSGQYRLGGDGHHQPARRHRQRHRRQDRPKKHIPGPLGVRGRNSDNRLIREKLDWAPSQSLRKGLEITYQWIEQRALGNSAARKAS